MVLLLTPARFLPQEFFQDEIANVLVAPLSLKLPEFQSVRLNTVFLLLQYKQSMLFHVLTFFLFYV